MNNAPFLFHRVTIGNLRPSQRRAWEQSSSTILWFKRGLNLKISCDNDANSLHVNFIFLIT